MLYKYNVVVEKSKTKSYGYALKDLNGNIPLTVQNTGQFGWYKYKSDALKRAKELNNTIRCTQCGGTGEVELS